MKMSVLAGVSVLLGTSFAPAQVDWPAVGKAVRDQLIDDPQGAKLFVTVQKSAEAALSDTPNPIKTIRTEGLLKGDPKKELTSASLADMGKVNALAWSALITEDNRYQTKAFAFLRAWAAINRSRNNPIDDTNLGPAIVAYAMLRPKATEVDRIVIDTWLRETADAAMHGKQQRNNWQNHRIKIVGLIGAALSYPDAVSFAKKSWQAQLGSEMLPDGSTTDFHERDALHYHTYSLDPLLFLAVNTGPMGEELLRLKSPNGTTLEKCVDFLRPFATGEKQHIEFVNTKVEFDRKRAANGQKEYLPHPWDPKSGVNTFVLASLYKSDFDELVARLSGMTEAKYSNWDAYVIGVQRSLRPYKQSSP